MAIVGRPNVGKSTLFNRVLGHRAAIVAPEPGVTRDLNFARAEWAGRAFYLVDTGGLIEGSRRELDLAIQRQVLAALDQADVVAFVVDVREGVHPLDRRVAQLLRERGEGGARTVLIANKADRWPETTDHYEFYELGLGDPLPVSAVSGKGSGDVLDRIVELLPEVAAEPEPDDALRLAVIGRPNVGKSSFVNRALGEERMVVTAEPGTTRDAIDTEAEYDGRRIVFVDTAGLRRRSRVTEPVEFYSVVRTERALARADVCLLLVDATEGATNHDFHIAQRVWKSGAGLVWVLNKWDRVEKDASTAVEYERVLRERAPFLEHVPIVSASALTGQRVRRVIDLAIEVSETRSRRIPTPEVNRRLRELVTAVPPPHVRGRPIRLYYAAQVRTRPPVFALWTQDPKAIPKAYARYLIRGFREAWGFYGTPIRLRFRARRKARRR
ncbi:MAG: ribosome biogenesis GTPase Der [Gemmatimonadota bacterium]